MTAALPSYTTSGDVTARGELPFEIAKTNRLSSPAMSDQRLEPRQINRRHVGEMERPGVFPKRSASGFEDRDLGARWGQPLRQQRGRQTSPGDNQSLTHLR
ncbi:hypothetical protein [Aminobacter sp. J41]|nr:hypothetical protein [Aminobacter sp. J41]TWH24005.1 hypothetical protein L611_007600000020 [Aminobacter sp. J15]